MLADDEEIVHRLLLRAKESHRTDDTEAVVRHRLSLYHEQTEAVVATYRERGILVTVNGSGHINEVADRVLIALAPKTTSLAALS